MAFALLTMLVTMVGAASAAASSDLYDPNVRVNDNFYPCPDQPSGVNRAPFVSECLFMPSLLPKQPLVVAGGETSCNPDTTSTIGVHRTQGFAGTPSVPGQSWVNGTITWDLNATIGPQNAQNGAIQPELQPFPDDGFRMNSAGFYAGTLTLSGTITINPDNVSQDIVVDVSSNDNPGNWGVCEGPFTDQVTGSQNYGNAPLTGAFYIINAGSLKYDVRAGGPAALSGESGIAEGYFSNTFATCCAAANPTGVNAATGHFRMQFGSSHPGEGTGGTASTPQGANVQVTNFVGLDANSEVGGVKMTFDSVGNTGAQTSVTLLTSMPDQPSGFQIGNPPAVYEIQTTATGWSSIELCLPYGSLPDGVTPQIKHYVNGEWVDVPTKSISGLPEQKICVDTTSLSPFAVGYNPHIYNVSGPFDPVDAYPTPNTMKAGRTVPVKFKLGGDYGLNVFADGYPVSQNVHCDATPPDPVEVTSSANAGLTYDAVSGVYQYNWKTSGNWKGQCRTLLLQFSDGQELKANFKFN